MFLKPAGDFKLIQFDKQDFDGVVSDEMKSRWIWLKRPRWLIAVGAALCLLGWLLWPIKVYDIGRTRGFSITLPVSSEATPRSIRVMPAFNFPDRIREGFISGALSRREVEDLGDFGFWADLRGLPSGVRLIWMRGNIAFVLQIRGHFGGHPPRSPEWRAACERVAREVDAEFLAGRAGSKPVKVRWMPRAVIWGLVARREWRAKQGLRTHGWW